MGGTNVLSCDTCRKSMTPKQRLRLYLTTKTAHYIWHLVDICSCKLERFAIHYEKAIGEEYSKEYTFLNQPKKKQVLHIGSGAYPLTDILIAQRNDIIHVTGIDNDPRTVRYAQQIIAQKQLQNRITISLGEGQTFPVSRYDVIIISSCSWPKMDIIEHVFTSAKKNSLIILRELNHITPALINCIKKHPEISIQKQNTHSPFPFYGPFGWQSLYLLKK